MIRKGAYFAATSYKNVLVLFFTKINDTISSKLIPFCSKVWLVYVIPEEVSRFKLILSDSGCCTFQNGFY